MSKCIANATPYVFTKAKYLIIWSGESNRFDGSSVMHPIGAPKRCGVQSLPHSFLASGVGARGSGLGQG